MISKKFGVLIILAFVFAVRANTANAQAYCNNDAKKTVVDLNGNVYVTGTSVTSSPSKTISNLTTIKYNSAGNRLWVTEYPGVQPSDLAVDALGNVYVTGATGSYGVDYVTIKYSSSGNQLWVAIYSDPHVFAGRPVALVVDALGNVYVTGRIPEYGSDIDYETVKYDSSGNQLWVAKYNGPAGRNDWVYAIALDVLGNVYVTGCSQTESDPIDSATVKYSPSGNQLWVARTSGVIYWGLARTLAIDSTGHVYIAGECIIDGINGSFIIKYDSSGNQLWLATKPKIYSVLAIATDASDNVYLCGGTSSEETDWDYATAKYDASGNLLWLARYNGPGGSGDVVTAFAVDAAGNAYVTGTSPLGGSGLNPGSATIKYDPSGNQMWITRCDSESHESFYGPNALALDASGNIYVAGTIRYSSNYNTVFQTFKYNSAGGVLWSAQFASCSVVAMIEALIQHVQAIDLKNGVGYTAKLEAALSTYQEAQAHDYANTINQMEAFETKCDNDPHLSVFDRNALKSEAAAIINYIKSLI